MRVIGRSNIITDKLLIAFDSANEGMLVYNRFFTESEVSQMYQSTRYRFGM